MSRFNKLMENQLNTTDLLRIRIKHDPACEDGELNEYVGYVLEEDGAGNVIAIVPDIQNDTMQLSPGQYVPDMETCQGHDPLTQFKKHAVKFLMSRGYHDKITKLFDVILNAKSAQDVEKVVGSCGNGVEIVLDLYRDFVSNEQF